MQFETQPKPFWHPLWAGIALGFVLLLTFLITGHGLGATGFTTRVTAWLASGMPAFMGEQSYLGPIAEEGIFCLDHMASHRGCLGRSFFCLASAKDSISD